jgi:hypothetical protein
LSSGFELRQGMTSKACPEPAEGCRKMPILIPALASAELQIADNKRRMS